MNLSVIKTANGLARLSPGKKSDPGSFRFLGWALVLAIGLTVTESAVCADEPIQSAPVEAVLVKAEKDFCDLCSTKGLKEGFTTFADADAAILVAGMEPVKGREAIGKLFDDMDGVQLVWRPTKAEVAASGDLGYTYGTYEMRTPDASGTPTVRKGKFTTVWKKQADSTWKYVLDVGTPDPPADSAPQPSPKSS